MEDISISKLVIDTTTIISYFSEVFGKDPQVSKKSISIFESAFYDTSLKIAIPSICIIEIYMKFFKNEEIAQKIKYEVLNKIFSQENISIIALEKEVLENMIKIVGVRKDKKFDNHDKQVLATAMMYNCPLITSDERMIIYNNDRHVIPLILS